MKTETKEQLTTAITTTNTNSLSSPSIERDNISPEDAKMEQKQLSFDRNMNTAKTVESIASSQADGSETAMIRAALNSSTNSLKL